MKVLVAMTMISIVRTMDSFPWCSSQNEVEATAVLLCVSRGKAASWSRGRWMRLMLHSGLCANKHVMMPIKNTVTLWWRRAVTLANWPQYQCHMNGSNIWRNLLPMNYFHPDQGLLKWIKLVYLCPILTEMQVTVYDKSICAWPIVFGEVYLVTSRPYTLAHKKWYLMRWLLKRKKTIILCNINNTPKRLTFKCTPG